MIILINIVITSFILYFVWKSMKPSLSAYKLWVKFELQLSPPMMIKLHIPIQAGNMIYSILIYVCWVPVKNRNQMMESGAETTKTGNNRLISCIILSKGESMLNSVSVISFFPFRFFRSVQFLFFRETHIICSYTFWIVAFVQEKYKSDVTVIVLDIIGFLKNSIWVTDQLIS